MQQFPCPNTACRYVFTAQELAGLPAVTCPGCGMTFQLRAPAPAPPDAYAPPPSAYAPPPGAYAPPGYPPPQPAYAPPPGYPGQGYAPPGAPGYDASTQPGTYAGMPGTTAGYAQQYQPQQPQQSRPEPPRQRRKPKGQSTEWIMIGSVLMGAIVVFGLVIVGFLYQRSRTSGPQPFKSEHYFYSFELPNGRIWREEGTARESLGANAITLARTDGMGYFALGAKDTEGRTTAAGELANETIRRLRSHFQEPSFEDKEDTDIGGQIAKRIVFKGETVNGEMTGEAFSLSYQGVDYWFFFWAPSSDFQKVQKEFKEMRERFKFLPRKGGTDKSALNDFFGDGYKLQDDQGLFNEQPKDPPDPKFPIPKDEPLPQPDLTLIGYEKLRKKDTFKQANVEVFILNGGGIEAAKAHVLAREKFLSGDDKYSFADAPLEGGAKDKVGESDGTIVGLKLEDGGDGRLVVLGAADSNGKTYAIRCKCNWKYRTFWEQEFVRLIGSFRPNAN